ncbi:MAG: methionyl-tRNA formyltransferase, partial [Nitrospinota bacterium]
AECLQEALKLIEEGTVVPRPQEERYATYAPRLKKEDGHIDWTRRARDIYNLIRGVIPWPGAYTFRQGSRLKIWWADWTDRPVDREAGEVIRVEKEAIEVSAGEGTLLLREVQPENRRRMPVREYLAGYPLHPGERLGA